MSQLLSYQMPLLFTILHSVTMANQLSAVEMELAEWMITESTHDRKVDWESIVLKCSSTLRTMILERTPKHKVKCSRMSYLISRKNRKAFGAYRLSLRNGIKTSLKTINSPVKSKNVNKQKKTESLIPTSHERNQDQDSTVSQQMGAHTEQQTKGLLDSPDEKELFSENVELAWLYADYKRTNPARQNGVTFWDSIQKQASPILRQKIITHRQKEYFTKVAYKCLITKSQYRAFMQYRDHVVSLAQKGWTYQAFLKERQHCTSTSAATPNKRVSATRKTETPALAIVKREFEESKQSMSKPSSHSPQKKRRVTQTQRRTTMSDVNQGEQQIGQLTFRSDISPVDMLVRDELQRQTNRLRSMLDGVEAQIQFLDQDERTMIQHDKTNNRAKMDILSAMQRLYSEFFTFRSQEEKSLHETIVTYRKGVSNQTQVRSVLEKAWNMYFTNQGIRFEAFFSRVESVLNAV